MQALLQGLWPCDSTLVVLRSGKRQQRASSAANVANPVDEVGLIAFPALSSTSSRPYEIDCNSSSSFAVTYPNPPTGNQPGYNIVGLSSDYRPSVCNTTLNATTSNLVEAVDWAQCPGAARLLLGRQQRRDMPSGTYYYTVNAATAAARPPRRPTRSRSSPDGDAHRTDVRHLRRRERILLHRDGRNRQRKHVDEHGADLHELGRQPVHDARAASPSPRGRSSTSRSSPREAAALRSGTWTVSYTGPAGQYPGGDYYGLKVIGGQGSYLAGAIAHAQYALDHSGRPGVTNAIIVLSDGALNSPHCGRTTRRATPRTTRRPPRRTTASSSTRSPTTRSAAPARTRAARFHSAARWHADAEHRQQTRARSSTSRPPVT